MTDRAAPEADEEFDAEYFRRMEAAADHWWVRGMREVAEAVLPDLGTSLDVLDLGCGAGASFRWLDGLRGAGALHGTDIASAAVRAAAAKRVATSVVQASMDALPYAAESFDLVVNADVMQHLTEDDVSRAVAEARRVLRPGGCLLVRVNGDSFRSHVVEEENWRLYNPTRLRRELEGAGLSVVRATYANSLPGLVAGLRSAARRVMAPLRGRGSHEHTHDHGHEHGHHGGGQQTIGIPDAAATGAVRQVVGRWWLRAEARWLRRESASLSFGHTVVAVARRPA